MKEKNKRKSGKGQTGQGRTSREERPTRIERATRAERPARAERVLGTERPQRTERTTGTERSQRTERATRTERPARAERPIRTERLAGREEDKKQAGKRKDSRCPVSGRCGGCQMIDISYKKQLEEKKRKTAQLLKPFCRLEIIHGMERPEHYRNKVSAAFTYDRKGNPLSGVYAARSHEVVPVESCLIEDEKADEIIGTIRGMLRSFKIKVYDEDTGYGLLRHVLVRVGKTSGQVMVVLVTASPVFPSKNNFVKALLARHPEITTIVLNVNDKRTSMVLGEKEHVLYGKGFIEDELCGKVFKISPKSFYQVNPVQTEVLYGKALEFAGLCGEEIVIDAYCGIGTIGIIASEQAKKVIGVEVNKDAVRDAVSNAKRNQVKNIDFYHNDAGKFMIQMAEEKAHADVVFLDPPRTGSDEAFLSSVVALSPERIVYISCNPETLARDLQFLAGKGYKVKRAEAVDMFPFTEEVECIVLLSRSIKNVGKNTAEMAKSKGRNRS